MRAASAEDNSPKCHKKKYAERWNAGASDKKMIKPYNCEDNSSEKKHAWSALVNIACVYIINTLCFLQIRV